MIVELFTNGELVATHHDVDNDAGYRIIADHLELGDGRTYLTRNNDGSVVWGDSRGSHTIPAPHM